MRIFVDTNIVSELLEERSLVDYIDQIFEKAEQKGWTRVLSVGSFYTITFLTEWIRACYLECIVLYGWKRQI